MVKSQKSRPSSEQMPFHPELGPRLGRGQDNVVFSMIQDGDKAGVHTSTGTVLKINHRTSADHRVRDPDEREATWRGLLYKKNKYELLKLFLGDFVPDTSFVMGKVTEGDGPRYAEYTVQEEVPRISLNNLSPKQRQDPRLLAGVTGLMGRLQYMYRVLGEVNARTANGINLDGKLDLGGVSSYVQAESLDHRFDESDAQTVINENKSPNLLINPDSMQLYCIDFDQGQWPDGANEAKALVEKIVQRDRAVVAFGHVAVDEAQGQLF
ncbi:hypothetical protein BH10PAT3_BH10PAT3_0070 [soil metagenome]